MKVTCLICGATAEVAITGRSKYQTTYSTDFMLTCPELRKPENGGKVDCAKMDDAVHNFVTAWRARNQR
jgi:hypothetical protein